MDTKTGVYTYQNKLSWKVDMTIRPLSGSSNHKYFKNYSALCSLAPRSKSPPTIHPRGIHQLVRTLAKNSKQESEERFPQDPKQKQLF
jgi:hypothetical protein